MLHIRRRDFLINGTVGAFAVTTSDSLGLEEKTLPTSFPTANAKEGLVEYLERNFGAWNERT